MKHSDQFLLATICRGVQGVAALAIVLASADHAPSAVSSQAAVSLIAATVLSGMGIGVAVDRWLNNRVGIRSNCVTACLFPLVGLSVAAFRPDFAWLLTAAVIAGLGTGCEWSGVAELARRSLPVIGRWRGMCVWTVAFAMGSAVAVLLSGQLQILLAIVLLMAIIAAGLLLKPAPLPNIFLKSAADNPAAATTQTEATVATVDQATPTSLPTRPESDSQADSGILTSSTPVNEQPTEAAANTAADTTANADCEAVECCGGQMAVVRPAAFGHGVLLVASVSAMFWGGIVQVGVALGSGTPQPDLARATFALGIPVGWLLLHSVAPQVGYAIATLPFLLCSVLSLAAISSLSLSGPMFWLVAFAAGVFPAAAVSGVTAVIGEQFTDCGTGGTRTRVLSVGMFAASAVLILTSGLSTQISPGAFVLLHTMAFVAALLLLRRLPSPMISSGGSDDDSDPEDAELQDVMAALSNRK